MNKSINKPKNNPDSCLCKDATRCDSFQTVYSEGACFRLDTTIEYSTPHFLQTKIHHHQRKQMV